MKIRMMIELDYDAGERMERDEKRWFMENVLLDKEGLLLHSNEMTILALPYHGAIGQLVQRLVHPCDQDNDGR